MRNTGGIKKSQKNDRETYAGGCQQIINRTGEKVVAYEYNTN